MQINSLMIDPGPSVFYTDSFRVVLESFLPILKDSANTTQIHIDARAAYKYEADFFGLLSEINIPPYLHWLVLRMNNFTSPLDSDTTLNTLLVPNETTIDYIRQSHMSVNRING